MAAVLGASLVGVDKGLPPSDDQRAGSMGASAHSSATASRNWVLSQAQYFNTSAGLLLNNVSRGTYPGYTFWYEIYPAIFFSCLVNRYPDEAVRGIPLASGGSMSMRDIMYATASTYYGASRVMGEGPDAPGFNYTSFNFITMNPVFNGTWREPDAAAGIAWIEYAAYLAFGEERFLDASDWAMGYLDSIDFNPLYESLLPYGAYVAARMNAELGRSFDLRKLVAWCFGPSESRPGWGVIADEWGGYEAHGLMGSLTDGDGYAFAMNTFDIAAALLPIVRYDSRYALAFGKWLLNLANNARLFYRDYLPDRNQSTPRWNDDRESVVAYEGLRKSWDGRSPFATGDSLRSGWGVTDFGLYGSSHVGMLGAIVNTTNMERILQLDLLATDHFHGPAFPSYLYYNPFENAKVVGVDLDSGPVDVYSPTEKRFIDTGVDGSFNLEIQPKSACVVVLVPAGANTAVKDGKLTAAGTVIDYRPVEIAITSPAVGQLLYGARSVGIALASFDDTGPFSFAVEVDGLRVYEASTIDSFALDTRGYPDESEHELAVIVTGVDGISAFDKIHFVADNRPLSQNGARDFRNWTPTRRNPGRLSIRGYSATLEAERANAVEASIISPVIALEVERGPVLVFDGIYPSGDFSVAVELEDGGLRHEAAVIRDESNYVELDLGAAIRAVSESTGAEIPVGSDRGVPVRIVLTAEGRGETVSFFYENVEIVYLSPQR